MSEAELREAAASGDEARLRAAIRACRDRLREGVEDDPFGVGEALLSLAKHPSARVRQDIADASPHLPARLFSRAVELLSGDPNALVERAIAAAVKRREAEEKAAARTEEKERAAAAALDAIARKHGAGARALAERAVREENAAFVSKLRHELATHVTALERVHARIASPDDARAAQQRLARLWATVEAARELTKELRPTYAEEALRDVVEEARASVFGRIGVRAARFVVKNEVSPALRLAVHRPTLAQALENLMKNGAEAYAEDAAEIGLVVRAEQARSGDVTLTIEDRGVGMNDEELASLFVPFGSQKPGGTGVGMGIARRMIEEAHGGALSVASARGEGTRVTIVLPARRGKKARS